jgi:hypothetical protein
MKTQIPNISRVRSAWRRVKEDIKDAIIRDLKPVKDVKGGVLRANPDPPQAATNKVNLTNRGTRWPLRPCLGLVSYRLFEHNIKSCCTSITS